MPYSELVKNFEKVRAYMRAFYVYGFKSRSAYDAKSARSYDDERRRIESWLGDYMRFTKTPEGKTVFLSVDSRVTKTNPFYRAWKTKSFTDGDITLHFILFDILHDTAVRLPLTALVEEIDGYLANFREPLTFDASTVRKKLKEYHELGLVRIEQDGRRLLYSRMPDTPIEDLKDVLHFFSEAAPCGVIGSFLLDRQAPCHNVYRFKHHYMNGAMDSDIMAQLFDAIHEKRTVTVENLGKHASEAATVQLVPLKIYISAQNGRQNLIAYHEKARRLNTYRLDYLKSVRKGAVCPKFDTLRLALEEAEQHMWGVNCRMNSKRLESVEFDVYIGADEQHAVRRLEREKRCGRVTKLDEHHYRFSAEVFDTSEMIPWIRTFICRITRLNFSNRTLENRLRNDLETLYRMYGVDGGETDAVF